MTNSNDSRDASGRLLDRRVRTRVTARKVASNPETWAGIAWIDGEPDVVGMEYDSRKEANQAARDRLRAKGF